MSTPPKSGTALRQCAPNQPCKHPSIWYSRYMDDVEVIAALAALAQPTRLLTFRLLVAREPEGVPAGELARLTEVPQNTMSTHLAILARARLIVGERQSRSIIYRANLDRFREVALSS
jgi:ArsR family transcriptional regulator, arsenate/arsenite/antimonite-responsive transcriptional repressor